MSKIKVYLNGKIIPLNEAKISVLDRGLFYGDGIFETLRTYNKKPFQLEEHIKRLLQTCKAFRLKCPMSAIQLKNSVLKTLAANNFKNAHIKIIVTRGEASKSGLSTKNVAGRATIIILIDALKPLPKQVFIKGWKAIISSIMRPAVPSSQFKTLNYINNVLAKHEAKKNGADEAILLDKSGNIVEATSSNIFIVKHGELFTPPTDAPILLGLTRKTIMRIAKQSAFRVVEKIITPKELYTADECFITSSGPGIIPITRVWNKKIGTGKCGLVTENLINLFDAETKKAS